MDSRSSTILEALIDEFIKTGKPVSSGELFDRYDFQIKPASIRLELAKLTDDGYLAKTYYSAGRVPTDKGYRFFINKIRKEDEADKTSDAPNISTRLVNELASYDHFDFIEQLSQRLHLLSIGYCIEDQNIYKKGLDELLESDDWQEVNDFVSIVRDFENIDDRLGGLVDFGDSGPLIFIGSNPLTKSNSLSTILDRISIDDQDLIIALIGPKRMDYRTNLGFLREIKKRIRN